MCLCESAWVGIDCVSASTAACIFVCISWHWIYVRLDICIYWEGLCVILLWVVNVHINVFRTKMWFLCNLPLILCFHYGLQAIVFIFIYLFSYYGEHLLILCLYIISINFKIKLFLKGGLTKQQKSKKKKKRVFLSYLFSASSSFSSSISHICSGWLVKLDMECAKSFYLEFLPFGRWKY